MARNFLTPIDLNKNALNNAVIQVLGTAPSSPNQGQIYYDSASANFTVVWNGSAWINPLARANHTGTQVAATISDFATTAQSYSLSLFVAPTADLNINSHKLLNVSTPTLGTDGVNKSYVDGAVQTSAAGISSKDPVNAVSIVNQTTLSGLVQTIDGVALNTIGMRVLLTGQTTASANGPYVVASGAWTRPVDEGGTQGELDNGALWLVLQGTVYAGTQWRLATLAVVVGTTSVSITQFSAASVYTAGNGILFTGTVISAVQTTGVLVTGAGIGADFSIIPRKFVSNIGDGSTTAIVVTHSLGSQDVMMLVRRATTPFDVIECDMAATSTTTATFTFVVAPTSAQFRVIIFGPNV